jgi:phage terminase large subunit-like protein
MALVVPPVTDLLRRSRAGGGTDAVQPMFPTIIALRNDRVVAAVSTPRMAATLSCAQTLAVGVGAEVLVLAAEALVNGSPALTCSVMTRDRRGKLVLQKVEGEGDQVSLSTPVDGGEPQDPTILRALAEAMSQQPVAVDQVARRDTGGTFGEETFLPAEQGRVVVDAGTVTVLQERVQQIGGQALYLPRSPDAARLALESGMPRRCLLGDVA